MPTRDSVVVNEEIKTHCGRYAIGRLTLNKPNALNALDLEMASVMLHALEQWQTRDDIVAVVIDSVGEKAFCAGGDIVSMYSAMRESKGQIPPFLEAFFTIEYTLDFCIHRYPKPIIVWASGIVMGGGMGLLVGASHRIVTETTKLAMPEISIGLFPDVGGSYFLPRLDGKLGLFLGLTGCHINANDAVYAGLADNVIASNQKAQLISLLISHNWNIKRPLADQVTQVLTCLRKPDTNLQSNLETHRQLIDEMCSGNSVSDVVRSILSTDIQQDKWLARAKNSLSKGSPITMHLVFEQCQRGIKMELSDCFRLEAGMSCRCGEFGEFQEGVRALLIDKDMTPKWTYNNVDEVPADVIAHFFASPWSEEKHPLASL